VAIPWRQNLEGNKTISSETVAKVFLGFGPESVGAKRKIRKTPDTLYLHAPQSSSSPSKSLISNLIFSLDKYKVPHSQIEWSSLKWESPGVDPANFSVKARFISPIKALM